jgi:hypothetical protein
MLEAFFDESSDLNPPIYTLAGYVSSSEKWNGFSVRWRQVLDMSPKIGYFKFSEALSRSGEFLGISDERIDEKIKLLVDVIDESAMFAVCASVRLDQYLSVFSDPHIPPIIRKSPYFFLFFNVLKNTIVNKNKLEFNEPCQFYFDEQVKDKEAIIKDWTSFKNLFPDPDKLINQVPLFSDDKRRLPLQAADLFAGFTRLSLQNQLAGRPVYDLPVMKHRHNSTRALRLLWDLDQLKAVRSRMDEWYPPSFTGTFGAPFKVY